jgi:hypothetical protein
MSCLCTSLGTIGPHSTGWYSLYPLCRGSERLYQLSNLTVTHPPTTCSKIAVRHTCNHLGKRSNAALPCRSPVGRAETCRQPKLKATKNLHRSSSPPCRPFKARILSANKSINGTSLLMHHLSPAFDGTLSHKAAATFRLQLHLRHANGHIATTSYNAAYNAACNAKLVVNYLTCCRYTHSFTIPLDLR